MDLHAIAFNTCQFFHGAVFIPVMLSLLPECCLMNDGGSEKGHQTKVCGATCLTAIFVWLIQGNKFLVRLLYLEVLSILLRVYTTAFLLAGIVA